MSFHFLQAGVAESWEPKSLAGAPSALLKLIPSRAECYSIDSETTCCLDSPSGMTCARSTVEAGRAKSTWLREGSHARTSVWPAVGKGWLGNAVACGENSLESFARYNRPSSSWRIPQAFDAAGLNEYSETWPQWGSMRSGECFERVSPELHTCVDACSYWPTPMATMAKSGFGHGKHSQGRYRSSVLERCAKIGWAASPEMLEAVLGWPVGWTVPGSLEMDRYREWLRLHSKPWHDERPSDNSNASETQDLK